MTSGVAQKPSATRSFASIDEIDFNSSAELQQLLAVVRATPMSRQDYNDLRDLIFSYKRADDTSAAKQIIIDRLTSLGVVTATGAAAPVPAAHAESVPAESEVHTVPIRVAEPTPVAARTQPTSPSTVTRATGMVRPQPSFAPVMKSVAPASATEPVAAPPAVAPVPPPAPVAESPAPVPVAPVTPVVAAESAIPAEPVPAAVPEPTAASAETVTYADPLERIKAIKKEVNASVGNPVNLIDANNEVGREYMNALLDAMKKVNGGKPGEVNAAMTRLEAAFSAVQAVAIDVSVQAAKTESAVPAAVAPKETQSNHSGSQTTAVSDLPKGDVSAVSLPKSALFSAPAPGDDGAVTTQTDASAKPPTATAQTTPSAPPLPPVASTQVPAPTTAHTTSSGSLASVGAEEGQLSNQVAQAMDQIKEMKAKQAEEISRMDPIMVPDVTNGLNQLLSEWKLFKSSGFFGTGPSGADHPLYKKLSQMQMSAVIAGRFEGATPEIKQSITDYMNGWRYEEGILHQHGETFEHYLRRVIKKILDNRENGN